MELLENVCGFRIFNIGMGFLFSDLWIFVMDLLIIRTFGSLQNHSLIMKQVFVIFMTLNDIFLNDLFYYTSNNNKLNILCIYILLLPRHILPIHIADSWQGLLSVFCLKTQLQNQSIIFVKLVKINWT